MSASMAPAVGDKLDICSLTKILGRKEPTMKRERGVKGKVVLVLN
jgi:hypothetical protein